MSDSNFEGMSKQIFESVSKRIRGELSGAIVVETFEEIRSSPGRNSGEKTSG